MAGQDIPISTAPAVEPAITDRRALGLSFLFSGSRACAVAIVAMGWLQLGMGGLGEGEVRLENLGR